jgi:S1-C subfamily serine protease
LNVGDILLSLNGTALVHAGALHRSLRHVAPGHTVRLQILRGSEQRTLELVPSEAQE